MAWPDTSDKGLHAHGMLGRFEVVLRTPLKWVLLCFYLIALLVYWLVGYVFHDRPENLIGRHKPKTTATTPDIKKHEIK